jgi:tRNA uridine 5-carbamoylmethylation protein Kti12
MAEILILTGPHGVGKSTVALALADRYDRVAHVEVDQLRHIVTPTGYKAPGKDGFARQHAIAVRNAADIARNFYAERFAVIIDDILTSRAGVDGYIEALKPANAPIHVVTLTATLEACQARNRDSKTERQPPARVEAVWQLFKDADLPGSKIDCTDLPIYAVADRLQDLTTHGESLVHTP